MHKPSATRCVVVFDMDGTLVHGDSTAQIIRQLLRRHWWRRLSALGIAPIGFALMAFPVSRRVGVSLFLWIATAGLSQPALHAAVDNFVRARRPRRIETSIAALQSELDAGNDVVIATGAFQSLAERVMAELQLRGSVRVIGSTIRSFAGGFIAHVQANGAYKLNRLAEQGVHPPFDRAWSDSALDLPLLSAARESHWVTAQANAPREVASRLPGLIVHTVPRR
jgi:phosphatidylglycerophosphatase C